MIFNLIPIRDSVLALPSADRDCARIDAHGESPRLSARTPFSQPFAMSGQLASAVTSVRIFFSRCIGGFQNSPREHRQWVPIIAGVSRFASHVGQSIMRGRARSIEVLPDEAALTLRLPDEIEERLFARAAERGETVEHTTIKIIRDALFQA